jgi:hypothetical protein
LAVGNDPTFERFISVAIKVAAGFSVWWCDDGLQGVKRLKTKGWDGETRLVVVCYSQWLLKMVFMNDTSDLKDVSWPPQCFLMDTCVQISWSLVLFSK